MSKWRTADQPVPLRGKRVNVVSGILCAALCCIFVPDVTQADMPDPDPPAVVSEVVDPSLFTKLSFDRSLHDMLPPAILARGVVRVSTTAYTPPLTFYGPDNREIIGIDADILKGLEIAFGVKFASTDLGVFSAIVPTLRAKRFDMSIGGFYDTIEAEKQVDIVDFIHDGMTIMVKRGNPYGIKKLNDLCGRTVAVTMATPTEDVVLQQAKACAKRPYVMSMPKMPDVLLALRTGRAEAIVGGYCTGIYTTAHQIGNGAGLEAVSDAKFGTGNLGIIFAKHNEQLRDAIQAGLQHLIDTGAYQIIVRRWGVEQLALHKATINNAGGADGDD